jgi:hypothetical protein
VTDTTDAQTYAQTALRHIRRLAKITGPRESTTPKKRQAAEYAHDVLRSLGIDTRLEPFRSTKSTYAPFVVAFGVAFLGSILYGLIHSPIATLLAAVLNGLGAWATLAELNFSDNWIRRILPAGTKQNAIGVVSAKEETRRRVVLMGHLAIRRTPIFYSSTVWHKLFVAVVGSTLVSMVAGLLAYALLFFADWAWLHWVAGVASAAQILGLVVSLRAALISLGPGASADGSGAASVLALGQRLGHEPLRHTEVWLVADDSKEPGCYGAAALAETHTDELRDAYFVALDIVNAGDPAYLAKDGLLRKYPVDPELLAIGRQVATERPELGASEHVGIAYTDATAILKQGFRGFTIDALPRKKAGALHWRQMADAVDKVEPDRLQRVHEFAWEVLQRLDQAA